MSAHAIAASSDYPMPEKAISPLAIEPHMCDILSVLRKLQYLDMEYGIFGWFSIG